MTGAPELQRLADRCEYQVLALLGGVRRAAPGRIVFEGRTLITIRPRPRKRAVRVDLAPGWPWPRRKAVLRAALGEVVWVTDERSLRRVVDIVRRTHWRYARGGGRQPK